MDDEERIYISNSECIMNSYDVTIKDEDYTLGYIMQHYIYSLYQNTDNKDVKYVSTNIPHPLENNLLIRIALENSVDKENSISNIKKIIIGTVDFINTIIVKLKGEMKNTFKSNLE